jgi:hypothetical protein
LWAKTGPRPRLRGPTGLASPCQLHGARMRTPCGHRAERRRGGAAGGGSSVGDGRNDGWGEQEGSKGHAPDKPRGGGAYCSGLPMAMAEMRWHDGDSSMMACSCGRWWRGKDLVELRRRREGRHGPFDVENVAWVGLTEGAAMAATLGYGGGGRWLELDKKELEGAGSCSMSLFADQNGHVRGIKRVGVRGGFARRQRKKWGRERGPAQWAVKEGERLATRSSGSRRCSDARAARDRGKERGDMRARTKTVASEWAPRSKNFQNFS